MESMLCSMDPDAIDDVSTFIGMRNRLPFWCPYEWANLDRFLLNNPASAVRIVNGLLPRPYRGAVVVELAIAKLMMRVFNMRAESGGEEGVQRQLELLFVIITKAEPDYVDGVLNTSDEAARVFTQLVVMRSRHPWMLDEDARTRATLGSCIDKLGSDVCARLALETGALRRTKFAATTRRRVDAGLELDLCRVMSLDQRLAVAVALLILEDPGTAEHFLGALENSEVVQWLMRNTQAKGRLQELLEQRRRRREKETSTVPRTRDRKTTSGIRTKGRDDDVAAILKHRKNIQGWKKRRDDDDGDGDDDDDDDDYAGQSEADIKEGVRERREKLQKTLEKQEAITPKEFCFSEARALDIYNKTKDFVLERVRSSIMDSAFKAPSGDPARAAREAQDCAAFISDLWERERKTEYIRHLKVFGTFRGIPAYDYRGWYPSSVDIARFADEDIREYERKTGKTTRQ